MTDFYKGRVLHMKSVALACTVLVALSACAMDVDTYMSPERVEVHHQGYEQRMATASLGTSSLRTIADHYESHGEGPVDIAVTYDPDSSSNTAAKATDETLRIASALRRYGVPDVRSRLVPVSGQGRTSETIMNFDIVEARAPAGCATMGGLDGKPTAAHLDYKYGCTIESQLARQIASPKDLLGREGLDTADGRRQSNIVERYKTGAANPELEGVSTQD